MAEQQINVAQQDTLEAIDNKIDTLDAVADNIYAKVDSEVAAINAGLEEVKKSVSDGKSVIATAITNKGVTTASDAEFATMANNIDDIVTLKEGTSDATVAANKMLSGVIGYGKDGVKVTGNIPSKAAATITPGTANQTIAAGQYLSGVQTIAGDANLVAGNIKKGTSIFGVTGTYDPVSNLSANTYDGTFSIYHAGFSCTGCGAVIPYEGSGYVQVYVNGSSSAQSVGVGGIVTFTTSCTVSSNSSYWADCKIVYFN